MRKGILDVFLEAVIAPDIRIGPFLFLLFRSRPG